MRAFLRPLLLRLLLLCVVLNLGDAPYVDELMAEMEHGSAVAVQVASPDSPGDAAQQAGAASHSVYEYLLANVALPAQDPVGLSLGALPGCVPPEAPAHPLSELPSSIEKPPRWERTA